MFADVMNVSLSLTQIVLLQMYPYMSQLIQMYPFLSIGCYHELYKKIHLFKMYQYINKQTSIWIRWSMNCLNFKSKQRPWDCHFISFYRYFRKKEQQALFLKKSLSTSETCLLFSFRWFNLNQKEMVSISIVQSVHLKNN